MPRLSKETQIREAVKAYLNSAEVQPFDNMPIDVKHVAESIPVSRTTLYHYDLVKDIKAAAERQRKNNHGVPKNLGQRTLTLQLRETRLALANMEERAQKLVARLAIVEANAARLGIDPEELFKPIIKPVRSTSHAGAHGRRR